MAKIKTEKELENKIKSSLIMLLKNDHCEYMHKSKMNVGLHFISLYFTVLSKICLWTP